MKSLLLLISLLSIVNCWVIGPHITSIYHNNGLLLNKCVINNPRKSTKLFDGSDDIEELQLNIEER